jgi:aminomethyltransferase
LWDKLVEKGHAYGFAPVGMVALDIARIEAGYLLSGVDYIPARKALIEIQKSSPLELGLGWAVDFTKEHFNGCRALTVEREQGSRWAFTGLEVNWVSLEALFGRFGLVPRVTGQASRQAVPVYSGSRQIGQATSHTFSPVLKKYIALASLEQEYAELGKRVQIEITVEYTRLRAEATVTRLPFFNPPRKKSL